MWKSRSQTGGLPKKQNEWKIEDSKSLNPFPGLNAKMAKILFEVRREALDIEVGKRLILRMWFLGAIGGMAGCHTSQIYRPDTTPYGYDASALRDEGDGFF